MPSSSPRWICCQLGSREHYAIPRVLHREGVLDLLLTDSWARHPHLLRLPRVSSLRKLAERRHDELPNSAVHDIGSGRVRFDLEARKNGWNSWETTIRRNDWFQEQLLTWLKNEYAGELRKQPPGIFFAYSCAARHLLRFFRDLGWTTVLGQIDPGIEEENLVAREVRDHSQLATTWEPAPARYWKEWHEEVALSDWLVVNSNWSRLALIATGIPDEKIRIVPLAYERPATPVRREYPKSFSDQRPLRVLFLGQINLRKGVRILFEAAEMLRDKPVEFSMVGPTDLEIPVRYRDSARFRWIGSVSRSEANRYYEDADVFLLPTLSDGFALTQLEAQARNLPLIASRFCGDVVDDGKNGYLVEPLNAEKLTALLSRLLDNSHLLPSMEAKSGIHDRFSLESLRENLKSLASESTTATADRSRRAAGIAGR